MGTRKESKKYQGKDIDILPLKKSGSIKNKGLKANRLVKGNG